LPDCVALRSSSEMRATVIGAEVAGRGTLIKVGFMCVVTAVVIEAPSFLSVRGGAQ